MNHIDIWKFGGGAVLAFFAAYGTALAIYPDPSLPSWVRWGWRIAGVIFGGVAACIIYSIFLG